MLFCSIDKLAVPVIVASKKNGPNSPLEDRLHNTDAPSMLTAHSSVMRGFLVAQYTQLC